MRLGGPVGQAVLRPASPLDVLSRSLRPAPCNGFKPWNRSRRSVRREIIGRPDPALAAAGAGHYSESVGDEQCCLGP